MIGGVADLPDILKLRAGRAPRRSAESQYRAFRKKCQIENIVRVHFLACRYGHKNTPYFYCCLLKPNYL
jgi:hypothetical protein